MAGRMLNNSYTTRLLSPMLIFLFLLLLLFPLPPLVSPNSPCDAGLPLRVPAFVSMRCQLFSFCFPFPPSLDRCNRSVTTSERLTFSLRMKYRARGRKARSEVGRKGGRVLQITDAGLDVWS